MSSVDPRIEHALAREVPLRAELEPDWEDVAARAGRRRPHGARRWRPVLVAAVVTASLAGAGVAIAAGLGAFEGTPAPPEVSTNFSFYNKMADYAVQQGFAGMDVHADVSKAHGVIEIQTPDGPEDLWVAPNDQGGQCWFIDWANDPVGSSGGMPGGGGCGTHETTMKPINPEGPDWTYEHPNLLTVDGSVSVDAATVRIIFHDGSTLTLPVVEHWFLGSLAKPAQQGDAQMEEVQAFDAAGNQVADWTPPE